MQFKKSIITLAIAATIQPLFAAENDDQDEIIVTATRTAQTTDDSLAAVTVITRSEIEASQANDLLELVSGLSGIQVRSSGGYGKESSIFMRGTNSNHLLVMIDGAKIGSATNGKISLQHIALSDIERIEIVKGPRSTLYGSEAIGGVIQIFTRKGDKKPRTEASISNGSNNTNKFNLYTSGSLGDANYSLTASNLSTDGFDVKNDTETDNDGYTNTSYAINYGYKFNENNNISIAFSDAAGNSEYDGTTNETDFQLQALSVKLTSDINDIWTSELLYSAGNDFSDNFKDSTFKSTFNTTRTTKSWQNNVSTGENSILSIGVDQQADAIESTSTYDSTTRDNLGLFVQTQWENSTSNLLVGLRNDSNDNFGSHNTGNIAYGYKLSDGIKTTIAYGTAFSAPTFNQLYWPAAGDPNLLPEESETTEISFSGKNSKHNKWSVNAYQTSIKNLISGWPPVNIGKANISGIDIEVFTQIFGWKTSINASYTDPRDAATNNLLPRRSMEVVKLSSGKQFGNLNSAVDIESYGPSFDDANNTTTVSGYQLVNLRVRYNVNNKLVISGRMDNLLDTNYQTVDGYNTAGLSAYIGLNYKL